MTDSAAGRRGLARRELLAGLSGAALSAWALPAIAGMPVDGQAGKLAAAAKALAPGRWFEIEGSPMADVFPARHPAWGTMGPRAVMSAWNGGALDSKRLRLVVTGGGHSDYGGNEIYAFDLATFEWRRLTAPSRYDSNFDIPGEAPIARHTYDGLEYLPDLDSLFMFGAALYPHGNKSDPVAWLFDFAKGRWRRGARAPSNGYPQTAYDAETGRILFHHHRRLMSYDPLRDRWKVLSPDEPWIEVGVAEIDWSTRRFVLLNPKGIFFYDLDRLIISRQVKAETGGDTEIERLTTPGLAYDPLRRRLVAWAGGRAVWSLDTRSFRWTRHDNREGPAPSPRDARGRPKTRGVFGRWRYVPGYDVFVGVNGTGDNVWLYKMPPLEG